MSSPLVVVSLAAAVLLGCSSGTLEVDNGPPTLLDTPLAELPSKLSETGVYRRLPERELSSRALAYEPSYPLFSDGGSKQRALVLPEGEQIETRDPAGYAFPTGTLIFKTFSFRTPESPSQDVPIETRLLRLTEDDWELAAYAWNDDGSDAELLDLRRAQTRQVLNDDGELIEHSIPSRLECRQCHESAETPVLGINDLQRQALPEHGPLTTKVLGYLVGNCVHCHNGTNGAASSFDLRPAVALDNLIEQPTASSATAQGIRVVPGDPEASILFLALVGGADREVKDMPPLGVAQPDRAALDLFSVWIRGLGAESEP